MTTDDVGRMRRSLVTATVAAMMTVAMDGETARVMEGRQPGNINDDGRHNGDVTATEGVTVMQ